MGQLENIYFTDIYRYIKENTCFIIDVRTAKEYAKNHIKGAVNIIYDKIEENMKKIPKNKIIIVYCQTGARSILAARVLAKNGYMVKNVIGGIKNYSLKHIDISKKPF